MAIKVEDCWSDPSFCSLSYLSQLLYFYLGKSRMINSLGILKFSPDLILSTFKTDINTLRESCNELQKEGFTKFLKDIDGAVYVCVKKHPYTLAYNVSTEKKMRKDLKALPITVVNKFSKEGFLYEIESLGQDFTPPTKEEVISYSVSKGYAINAETFIEYYSSRGWKDSRGRGVKDWKRKLSGIWFKDENKIKVCKDAPKGLERFHVVVDGEIVTPDYWRDGKPCAKSIVRSKKLKEQYVKEEQGYS